jgi:acetaldehyde dehydrogenase/alcohol dehydrogenase
MLGRVIFGGRDAATSRQRLFDAVDDLLRTVEMPRTLAEAGVDEAEFENALPELAFTAFQDLDNRTNPRMPLLAEITDLLRRGYHG